MEFTQPLGVGLGLAVRINNQSSHPVFTGKHSNTYATINNMWEISSNTSNLLSNVNVGIREIAGMGYHVYDMQTMKTDELQLMTS